MDFYEEDVQCLQILRKTCSLRPCPISGRVGFFGAGFSLRHFCISENHSLNEWFQKAYGDE